MTEYGFAWANMALSLCALDSLNFDVSLPAYEQAVTLMPHRSRTHYSLGMSLIQLRAWTEAAVWLQMATKKSPRFPEALFQLGRCHQEIGQTKLALEVGESSNEED